MLVEYLRNQERGITVPRQPAAPDPCFPAGFDEAPRPVLEDRRNQVDQPIACRNVEHFDLAKAIELKRRWVATKFAGHYVPQCVGPLPHGECLGDYPKRVEVEMAPCKMRLPKNSPATPQGGQCLAL